MQELIRLRRQLCQAEGDAADATCKLYRQEHENLARAYRKIIEVSKRGRL